MSRYRDILDWLERLEVARGWDLGLGRMEAALERLGRPDRAVPAIHVAGTNGKGSTAAMLESVLRADGRRTGLFTSPHLVDFAERIRAGGAGIPHETVVALVDELRGRVGDVPLTHFEFVTLVAFTWFARIGVEIAVIEVGLGGRLDATNVITPLVGVITSIARDHEAFLGTTIRAIAGEKAGIAKPEVPLVVGPVEPDAMTAIRRVAGDVGAPVVVVDEVSRLTPGATGWDFVGPNGATWPGLHLGLRGAIQQTNACTALTTLAVLPSPWRVSHDAVCRGLADVWWPARLAVLADRDPQIVIDGAHNPAGAAVLARELPDIVGDRRVVLLVAVMADKDWSAILERLLPSVVAVVATSVGSRALDPERLAVHARTVGRRAEAILDPAVALAAAEREAGPGGVVLVAGSLFLAGEVYRALGRSALVSAWQGWGSDGRQPPA